MTPQEKIQTLVSNLHFEMPEALRQQLNVTQSVAQMSTEKIARALGSSVKSIEAINEALKPHEKTIQKIRLLMEHIKEVSRPISAVIERLHEFGPIVYVPVSAEAAREHNYLDLDTDIYGFFVIAGVVLPIMHSRGSRTGKLLKRLLMSKSRIVSYSEIQEYIGAGDRNKAFKDLNYNLKCKGYKLDCVRVKGEGIALKGIYRI